MRKTSFLFGVLNVQRCKTQIFNRQVSLSSFKYNILNILKEITPLYID